jgi:hypothetical protein
VEVVESLMPGQTVYLRGDMGDVNPETHLSVTVPHGTPALITNFFEEGLYHYARLDIPTSPGQKMLRTELREFHLIWQTNAPHPADRTFWERVLEPRL